MRRSFALLASRVSSSEKMKGGKSLLSAKSLSSCALSVHFYHPRLGMKSHEILSRATAFLVGVDPPDDKEEATASPLETMLKTSKKRRDEMLLRQNYNAEPASGPPRDVQELGWLEFVPKRHRPIAHVIASSHVVSPWKWKHFYPQDWLTQIEQKHVTYSLDVYNNNNDTLPVAKFACHSSPIHHPDESIDVAILHLKQEETALKHLHQLGIPLFQFNSSNHTYQKNDTVFFEGYQVMEDETNQQQEEKKNESQDDDRVFVPFTEEGNLIFASPTRFLAKTQRPLPEGLCGGPVFLNKNHHNNQVCGVVEGIVPVDHEDQRMAGAASFLPSPLIADFIEYAEHEILKKVVPETLYDKIVDLKTGKGLSGKSTVSDDDGTNMDESLKELLKEIQTTYPKEQSDAILSTLARERQEVWDTLQRKGGDMDEVIAQVRTKTRKRQEEIIDKLNKEAEYTEKEMENTNHDENDKSKKD